MRLLKPSWLEHRDKNRKYEIQSASVSPDGKRLATGGLDGKVRVWSTEAIAAGDSHVGPRLLASMSSHTGTITSVRFSPNGQYLVSGSDDRIALVWQLDQSRKPRQEFGQEGEVETEIWTSRKRLSGHESDIQDIAWSPDSSLLITVGLDSTIIAWSGTTFEKLARIEDHRSHVKGVAFDPANKYFVTASDDRTARVFRYARTSPTQITFNVEAIIEQPFKNSPLSTYFRRCSWSPNGESIACSNATNGPVPTVSIINRGEWDSDVSLVGHEAPCEVAVFSPRMYTPQPGGNAKDAVAVIATAGHDRTLAIWNTQNPRPLLVAHNVSDKPICDISWAPDGLSVYAVSLDGSIFMAQFAPGDLGYPVDDAAVREELERYGGKVNDMDMIESVEQLDVESRLVPKLESAPDAGVTVVEITDDATPAPSEAPAPANITASNTSAPASTAASTSAAPATGNGAVSTNEPTQQTSTPAPATAVFTPGASAPAVTSATAPASSVPPAPEVVSMPAPATVAPVAPVINKMVIKKQKITVTKDGRKRIAPTLVTEDSSAAAAVGTIAKTVSAPAPQQAASIEYSRPTQALPRGGIPSLVIGAKRKADTEPTAPAKKAKQEIQYIRPAVVNPAATVSNVRLAAPKVATRLTHGSDSVFEARNGEVNDPARLSVTHMGRLVFIEYVPGYAHLLAGSADTFWAAATEDSVVHIFTPVGSRPLPAFVLGSTLSILEAREWWLVAITSTGMLHMWDIREGKALFSPVSLAPILDASSKYGDNGVLKAPSITQCLITEQGKVLVALSSGTCYTYSPEMLTWHQVSQPFWAYGSQYWDSTGFAGLLDGAPTGPVAVAERRTNDEALLRAGPKGKQLQRLARNRMLQDGYQGFEGAVSVAHLEQRVVAAAMLESQAELEKFLEMYVRRLAVEGQRERLNFLFEFLMAGGTWGGLDKKQLLQQALKVAAPHRAVQTLIVEYEQVLQAT